MATDIEGEYQKPKGNRNRDRVFHSRSSQEEMGGGGSERQEIGGEALKTKAMADRSEHYGEGFKGRCYA